MIVRNKSTEPDGIPVTILKLGGEAMIPYLAQFLDMTIMPLSQRTGKKPWWFPFTRGGDQSVVTNYRLVSLISLTGKQMEHIIGGYLRQVWDRNEWLYKGQHGFGRGYSRESQIVTVCQDFTDSLDEGARIDVKIIDFSKAFSLVPLAYGKDIWRNIESAERL